MTGMRRGLGPSVERLLESGQGREGEQRGQGSEPTLAPTAPRHWGSQPAPLLSRPCPGEPARLVSQHPTLPDACTCPPPTSSPPNFCPLPSAPMCPPPHLPDEGEGSSRGSSRRHHTSCPAGGAGQGAGAQQAARWGGGLCREGARHQPGPDSPTTQGSEAPAQTLSAARGAMAVAGMVGTGGPGSQGCDGNGGAGRRTLGPFYVPRACALCAVWPGLLT